MKTRELLEEFIFTMSLALRDEFRLFMRRHKKHRKDMDLFELLCEPKVREDREIMLALYEPGQEDAYHGLRKTLTNELSIFLVARMFENEKSELILGFGNIMLAEYLIEQKSYYWAGRFASKAEKNAEKDQHYDFLELVYNYKLTYEKEFKIELDEVLAKKAHNMAQHQKMQKLNEAFAKIRSELRAKKKSGAEVNAKEIIDSILAEFNITNTAMKNPDYMHKIAVLCRDAIMSTKDYLSLYPYLIWVYETLKAHNSFSPTRLNLQLSFLYMISHTLYRIRRFADSTTWLEQMITLITVKKLKSHKMYPKILNLQASIACYTGKLKEAIRMTEDALYDKEIYIPEDERLNMILNLAVFYFYNEEFKKANAHVRMVMQSDKQLDILKGKEWRFKKELIEAIIHHECGRPEMTADLLKSIQKNHKPLLKLATYVRAESYIALLILYIEQPDMVTKPAFAEKVKAAKLGPPGAGEDIQAIAFFCWLQSKMQKRVFYEVLMERFSSGV